MTVYEISSDAKRTSTRRKQGLRFRAPCFYYLFFYLRDGNSSKCPLLFYSKGEDYSFVFFGEWHIEADGQDAQLQPQEDLPLRLSEIIL